MHGRIHDLFVDFLEYADGLPPVHPLNDKRLATKLEIVLGPDGRIQRMRTAIAHPGSVRSSWSVIAEIGRRAGLDTGVLTSPMAFAQLVEAAKEAGGRDNITAVLLEFDDVSVASTPIKRTISTITPPEARAATPAAAKRRKRHHLTWRTPLALLIFLGVFVGAYFIVHWYAYSTYYLANDNGTVAVYQGQPGGVLWFKSLKVADTNYKVNTLTADQQRRLAQTISEPTLTQAFDSATSLCTTQQCVASTTPSTTTTSTTTTTLKKG